MNFTEQLKILLWKNWILKKRNVGMTVMELVLPLCLFAILIILRNQVPEEPRETQFHPARPLPSAGLIPLMQSFCVDGTIDDDDFRGQPGSVLDIILAIFNGITKLADGDLSLPFASQREVNIGDIIASLRRPPDPLNTNKFPRQKGDIDLVSSWKENRNTIFSLISMSEEIMKENPTASLHVMQKIEELTKLQQKMRPPRGKNNFNTTVPEVCERFGLPGTYIPYHFREKGREAEEEEEEEPTTDWWEILMAAWGGLEFVICENPSSLPWEDLEPELKQAYKKTKTADRDQGSSGLDGVDLSEIIASALANNPRILYAPSGTEADRVIQGMYGPLSVFNDLTEFSRGWLVLSEIIREELNQTDIQERRRRMRRSAGEDPSDSFSYERFQEELVTDYVTDSITEEDSTRRPFTLPDFILPTLPPDTIVNLILELLDGVDFFACNWLTAIDQLNLDFLDLFQGFPSQFEMEDFFLNKAQEEGVTVIASIAFDVDGNGTLPPHLTYRIRQNATISQTTNMIQNNMWVPGQDWRGAIYLFNGFVYLQDIIERSIIDVVTGTSITEPGIYIQEFPTPCYRFDEIKMVVVEAMFPLAIVFSFVFYVAMLVRNIVYEKEQRLKEVMKLMGLEATVHWAAWFITAFIQILITLTLLTILLTWGNVLRYTDGFLLWILFLVFGLNSIAFSFFMSVLFNEAKIASACAGIFYLLTYVPYMIISILDNGGYPQSTAVKTLMSFFSTTGWGLSGRFFNFYEQVGEGVQFDNLADAIVAGEGYDLFVATMMSVISTLIYIVLIWYIDNIRPGWGLSGRFFNFYEQVGEGVQFDNLADAIVAGEGYDLFVATMMSVISTLIYIVLIWYIDNIRPGDYGLPRPWYFPFTVTYWCASPAFEEGEGQGCYSKCPPWLQSILVKLGCFSFDNVIEQLLQEVKRQDKADSRFFDEDPANLKLSLKIQNLSKVYPNGKMAVDDLCLNLYENQILSFLGHNGAGKTTTMSVLTGMIPATSGTAYIYDKDIRSNMQDIRKSLGLCPQHNVLFDGLTVEEHLKFYARLKGTSKVSLDLEVEAMLDDTGLRPKRFNTIDALSGGMKRKLSIGIAFISGSRTVILDEPTAGVDPWSRREIWDLVLKFKQGRTIMLSTHHMDEADILGDRIAVISHGSLKCCGPSLFLKSTFGEGYHLIVAKKIQKSYQSGPIFGRGISVIQPENAAQFAEQKDSKSTVLTKCSERKVTTFIKTIVHSAYLKTETPRELHYILPFNEVKSGKCGFLFDQLDSSQYKLDIDSYGITDTSLEEVFLKVTAYAKAAAGEEARKDLTDAKLLEEDEDRPKRLNKQNGFAIGEMANGFLEPMSIEDSNGRIYTPDPVVKEMVRRNSEVTRPNMRRRSGVANTTSRLRRAVSLDEYSSDDEEILKQEQLPVTSVETQESSSTDEADDSSGAEGSYVETGFRFLMIQFTTCMLKRMLFTLSNWKALVSQVVLPVIFVTVAMLIGVIGGPTVEEEPALELSTAMFFNETKGVGDHYVPFSNHKGYDWSYNAAPWDILDTYTLPSGLGATCVLTDTNWNSNVSEYGPLCQKVLWKNGKKLPTWTLDDYTPSPDTLQDEEVRYYPECQCALDRSRLICDSDGYEKPPYYRVITQDILQNITTQDETDYLYYTTDLYRTSRFGANSYGHTRQSPPYWLVKLPFGLKHIYKAKVSKAWYDSRGWHAMPAFINSVNNALLRANLPEDKGNPAAYGITAINHPMNGTTALTAVGSLIFGAEFIIAIFVVVGFSFIPAGFILFLVEERSSNSKLLQFVSGLNPLVYWISNLLWDMILYLIPLSVCALVLWLFGIPAFTEGDNYLATLLLMLIFGWACTPIMYPSSFLFNEASAAYVFLAVFNIFIGVSLLFITFLLDYFTEGEQSDTADINDTLKQIFIIFPTYAMGRGLMDIVLTSTVNQVNELLNIETRISPFAWNVTGRNYVAMAVMGVLLYILTILIEYKFFIKPKVIPVESMAAIGKEDADVGSERQRVTKGRAREDLVRLENLTKIYRTRKLGKHLAVHRLCLGIPKGECFGMLGVNGAGKTTTFKMLTGDHPPNGGDAYIGGHSILKDMNNVRKSLGYCPQFDALFMELTARQHLQLYSRLRGVPSKDRDKVVDWALRKLELVQYADRPAGTYSGGNKRKLSTALALLGNPPVIFLDEPTAGMDPYAKRFLWDLILSLIQEGKCIVLTSHSMEECETLCTRVSIMVQGKFRCLGSVQHLKTRFGEGYNIKIIVKGPDYDKDINTVIRYMNTQFAQAHIKERHFDLIEYEFRPQDHKLSKVFSRMERAKQEGLPIEDYSVCQNTLDNVFINFVKEQKSSLEDADIGQQTRMRSVPSFRDSAATTPLLADDPEEGILAGGIENKFISNVLDIDELDALGTNIILSTPV